jgi:hypothetical protein
LPVSSSTSECTELDARDLLGHHALRAQLHAGVDAGVDDDAAGKRLVGVERDLEALAQLVGDLVPARLVDTTCIKPRGASSGAGWR